MSDAFSVKLLTGLESIPSQQWNNLTDGSNPFVKYDYLYGLEQFKCLDGHGWSPRHLAVYADTTLIGAIPLYLRTNSTGEFVFDWSWADAYEQAVGNYYPKLVSAIPFAPVIGPRILVNENNPDRNQIRAMLAKQLVSMTKESELSSCHALFTAELDHVHFQQAGFMPRLTCQFHWQNKNYRDFDDFLDTLVSKKRKQIKRERKQVNDQGIEIEVISGKQITEAHWRSYYPFYSSTFYRRHGEPRLTPEFFQMLGNKMPDQTMLILAKQGNAYVAGAFAMLGQDTLYGRHWGCNEQFPFLHFELCYYQTIEFAINHGLQTVDAGVQGEHKIARGFDPVAATSYHWLRHAGFSQAISDFLRRETIAMNQYLARLAEQSPYRQTEPDNIRHE